MAKKKWWVMRGDTDADYVESILAATESEALKLAHQRWGNPDDPNHEIWVKPWFRRIIKVGTEKRPATKEDIEAVQEHLKARAPSGMMCGACRICVSGTFLYPLSLDLDPPEMAKFAGIGTDGQAKKTMLLRFPMTKRGTPKLLKGLRDDMSVIVPYRHGDPAICYEGCNILRVSIHMSPGDRMDLDLFLSYKNKTTVQYPLDVPDAWPDRVMTWNDFGAFVDMLGAKRD